MQASRRLQHRWEGLEGCSARKVVWFVCAHCVPWVLGAPPPHPRPAPSRSILLVVSPVVTCP